MLILFGALLGGLLFGVGQGIGTGSSTPSLPAGPVVFIEQVPRRLGTITKAEFEQALVQQSAFAGLIEAPKPGSNAYDQLKDEALKELITAVWLRGQAQELGVRVTDQEVAKALKGSSEATSLRAAHFTSKTLKERARLQLAMAGIQEKLGERATDPSEGEIRGYYEENPPGGDSFAEARGEIATVLEQQKEQEVFSEVDIKFPAEWQPRTHCAEGFVVPELCAGSSPFAHPSGAPAACYEADPREPAEACPAPVPQRMPAMPGSVRPWKPEGERLVQRPVPVGGGDAGAAGEERAG
jgi:hypothetical protein